ncbi:MAG: hypothetical protein ABI880_01345 [Acidobacteriota bacterium]
MDIAQLRKQLIQAIEAARRDGAARRARADEANRLYETFLETTAIPVFRAMAGALKGEGLLFDVMTPLGGVRLVPERQREDGIELTLDSSVDPPAPVITVLRSRGSRTVRRERPLTETQRVEGISDDDVARMLIEELRPWLER